MLLLNAKLPAAADNARVMTNVYQWCAGITTDGANLPLALPLRVDRTGDLAMQVSFITTGRAGEFGSAADLGITIEDTDDGTSFVVLRFAKGELCPAEMTDEAAYEACVDAQQLMGSMPTVLKKAVSNAL